MIAGRQAGRLFWAARQIVQAPLPANCLLTLCWIPLSSSCLSTALCRYSVLRVYYYSCFVYQPCIGRAGRLLGCGGATCIVPWFCTWLMLALLVSSGGHARYFLAVLLSGAYTNEPAMTPACCGCCLPSGAVLTPNQDLFPLCVLCLFWLEEVLCLGLRVRICSLLSLKHWWFRFCILLMYLTAFCPISAVYVLSEGQD